MSIAQEQAIARKLASLARANAITVTSQGRRLVFGQGARELAAYPLYRPAIVSESVVRSR